MSVNNNNNNNKAVTLKSYVGKGNVPTKEHFDLVDAKTEPLQEVVTTQSAEHFHNFNWFILNL